MTDSIAGRFTYEADEDPKRKHGWNKPYAGFDPSGVAIVGKCPSTMTTTDAQALLDNAIPYHNPRSTRSHPDRLYAVHDGVVYRAVPTQPGVSYHGFPEYPTKFGDGRRKMEIKQQLLDQAESLGCLREVRRWMRW